MMFPLRRVLCLLAAATAVLPGGARSQAYPLKPIRVIISFAPGGSLDLVARLLAPRMAESMGQPVVAENRAGAGGSIGAEAVAHAAPDGYTILFTTPSTHVIGRFLNKSLPYDPVRDFAGVGIFVVTAYAFASNPGLPARNLEEFVQVIRKSPGKYNYASPGNGTVHHLAVEMMKQRLGLNLQHVPYKDSSGATLSTVSTAMVIGVKSLTGS